jgi:multiple sugar transport system substrate-binding protein
MPRHPRRLPLLALVTLSAVSLVITGCGRGSSSTGSSGPGKAVSAGPAKGDISVWAMGTEGEKLSVLARSFEKENPGAHVHITPVPWDSEHDKISTAIAAGKTPDMSLIGTTELAEYAKTGGLRPVPAGLVNSASFFPGPWQGTSVGGTHYGVPWYVDTRVLYYRTDLAAKAGVRPPTTWDELTSFARALQQKGGATWGINLQAGGTGSWQTFLPFVWQAGGSLTDGKTFTIDTPQFREAAAYYQKFFTSKVAPTTLPQGELESDFAAGKIASFVSGPWEIANLTQLAGAGFKDRFATVTLPAGKTQASFVGGGDLGVFSDAKNPDAAWKFVRYLSQPKVQATWYKTVDDLPATTAAWTDPALADDKFISVFGKQLEHTQSPPAIATWEQVANVLDTNTEQIDKGTTSVDAGIKAMQQQATQVGTGS